MATDGDAEMLVDVQGICFLSACWQVQELRYVVKGRRVCSLLRSWKVVRCAADLYKGSLSAPGFWTDWAHRPEKTEGQVHEHQSDAVWQKVEEEG